MQIKFAFYREFRFFKNYNTRGRSMNKTFAALLLPSIASASIPLGDTQGIVSAITVDHSHDRSYDSFMVHFESIQNDRFNCIKDDGYVRFRSNGVGMNERNFQLMYSMVLSALASEKTLSISHSGTNPCINANGTRILK